MLPSTQFTIIALLTLTLTACLKDAPIAMGQQHPQYLGTWYLHDEQSNADSHHFKSVLFEINGDGTATYLKCIIVNDATGNHKHSSRTQVTFDNAKIIELSANKLVLEKAFHFIHIENTLEQRLQVTGNDATLTVEGLKLTKASPLAKWTCPEENPSY